jgi:hypothetical protein
MVELLLIYIELVVAVTAAGAVAFLVVYLRTQPWQTAMGRHVLIFMAALGIAFLYAPVAQYLPLVPRLVGWALSLTSIAIMMWWRTAKLVRYQREAQSEAKRLEKETRDA